MTTVRLLTEPEVRALITVDEARHAVRDAFVALHRGQATNTSVLEVRLPHNGGELHGKGAFIDGSPFLTVKMATGFPTNQERGLPDSGGLSMLFDSGTGLLAMILFDNGYLTQLRTGSAGALAAELLAREDATTVAMVGAGLQARYQLEALLAVRDISRVTVTSRSRGRAEAFAKEMSLRHGVHVDVAESARDAVPDADIVVTTTPSEQPVVLAGWVRPGTHITAVGSDFPGKQELDLDLLGMADLVVADELVPGKHVGEISQAVAQGVLRPDEVVSLGAVAAGDHPGRRSAGEVTIADLTGIGAQDAAVAGVVATRAFESGTGQEFDPRI
jgi:ornithine cyclodeaminase